MTEKQFLRWLCFLMCGYISIGALAFFVYVATTTNNYVAFFALSPMFLFPAAWFGWCAYQAWLDKL
ncbi:hypothetical protein CHELA1G11_13046 [Hyphomicrobiales bacterium]|nr:hypothetical protein CHELA1G2_11263 [Hyphomicrobiales bacterium]CAH1668926.1 hypothetical protein CHELA1G11_13046 [Hyphomicrobiales bacterium]